MFTGETLETVLDDKTVSPGVKHLMTTKFEHLQDTGIIILFKNSTNLSGSGLDTNCLKWC